jgi:hypothetical protein
MRAVKRELVRAQYAARYPGEPQAMRQAFSDRVKAAVAEGFMLVQAITLDGREERDFWSLKPC